MKGCDFINIFNKYFRPVFSFVLIISIITVFVISPVSADSFFDDIGLVNVLDYVEDYDYQVSNVGTSYTYLFDFPYQVYYIDCVVSVSTSSFRASSFSQSLNVKPLGNNFYRVYGNVGYSNGKISLTISSSINISYIVLFSFEAATQNLVINSLPYSVQGYSVPTGPLISADVSAGDTYNFPVHDSRETFEWIFGFDYTIWLDSSIWKSYDYIFIRLRLTSSSLNSCMANLGDFVLPTILSHSSNNYNYDTNDVPDIPYSHYGLIIDLSNYSRLSNVTAGIHFSGTYESQRGSSSFGQIIFVSGFVKPEKIEADLVWYKRIYLQIQSLINGSNDQNDNAENFTDSVDEQASELEDLTGDLNSVTRPALSDVNLSTSTMVDSSVIMLTTNGIGTVISNPIILRVLVLALTFALAGFILFGKR